MDRERWRRVREVFAAVESAAPAERAARLLALCGPDEELRLAVEQLLAASEGDALRTGGAVAEGEPGRTSPDDAFVGKRFGPWQLRERIGRGGMGQVFLAERADGQFEQRVAVKLLGVGLDDPASVTRFRVEREILARLAHPNIARLVDGGVTGQGLPYLVMEYVRGVPVTEYCDRERLPIPERLLLFQRICQVVQYAHQNLVVHRDLKPSNILVDELGEPKLLDFGIAKLLEPSGGADVEATRTAMRLMTPAFASPEQVRGEPVSTATDVYALGLLLHEILTGRRAQPIDDLSPADLQRRVCETAPERVGTAAVAGPDAPQRAAQRGGVSPERLRRLLEGDLETILSKSLQKEPQRRYGSAAALAEDVGRHLKGLPVQARPDTLAYRSSRFVRRHRFGVAAAGLATVALIGFAAAMAAKNARIAHEAEAKSQVTAFLIDLFKVSDPAVARGRAVTARELLDAGAAKIDTRLQDKPEMQSALMFVMGNAYFNLGLYAEAEQQHRLALETRRRVLGPEHPDTLQSAGALANSYVRQGGLAEAEALYRETLSIMERVLGPEHVDTLKAKNNLASVIGTTGRHTEAEAIHRATLETQRRIMGPEDPATLLSMMNLATQLHRQGRDAEAEPLYREALVIQQRVLGPEHPATLLSMSNLGNSIGAQGRLAEAEALHLEALEIRTRVLGPTHRDTLISSYNLACWTALQGKRTEALDHLARAIEGGYPEADSMAQDPDLAPLRDDPRFEALLLAARENQKRLLPRHPGG
ncbi:MAG: serine/threonine-protein kinase [Acidobacteria bacterium]|nr:serine/threonine-protein kinase [Acidobacteriota bacterium]